MTDRELLELAAKAAGIDCDIYGDSALMIPRGHPAQREWNPLTDDGDALRLAVKLGLMVYVMLDVGFTGIRLPTEHVGGKYDVVQTHEGDPYTATRRAIVRAAAEIGK